VKADDPRHGTVAGYNRIPCRDECCRKAMSKYKQNWHLDQMRGKSRIVPALGMQRRIQALSALGWSTAEVARRAGMHPEHLPRMMRVDTVTRATHERIDKVYRELSMRLPTEHPQAIAVVRNRARRNGWPPPLAWDNIDNPDERPHVGRSHTPKDDVDEVVVQRLLDGQRLDCTTAERHEAMRRWRAMGKPERQLCLMQGWKDARYGRDAA
jgi:hypothetical protein